MGDESDADVEELRAPVDIAMARCVCGVCVVGGVLEDIYGCGWVGGGGTF